VLRRRRTTRRLWRTPRKARPPLRRPSRPWSRTTEVRKIKEILIVVRKIKEILLLSVVLKSYYGGEENKRDSLLSVVTLKSYYGGEENRRDSLLSVVF
jgi:hypothetical protein